MATKGFRVRLDDGSEMDLDSDMLRSWFEQGLIHVDTPMRVPGSRSWQRLDDAVELKSWKQSADAGRAGGGDDEAPAVAGPQKWRSYLASALLFAIAVAAAYLAYVPERWTPALAPTPWKEIALGAAVLALGLMRGWPIGRMFARVVMLVAAFALFPLAGLLIAQGIRGTPLLVLGSAWVLASGFFAFLGGVLATSRAIVWLLTILLGAAGIFYFGYVPPGTAPSAPMSVQSSPAASAAPSPIPAAPSLGGVPPAGVTSGALATPAPAAPIAAPPAGHAQAVRTATEEVPLLSSPAAEALMAQSAGQILEPPEVFRRSYGLVGRGLRALNQDESKELGELHTLIYVSLPPAERAQLGDYIDRARSGYATSPEEDRQMSRLMKSAVLALPADRRARLQALFEKALNAGLARP
jgi:hypothetical protein